MWTFLLFSAVFSDPIQISLTSIFNNMNLLVSGFQGEAFSLFESLDSFHEENAQDSDLLYVANSTISQEMFLHYFKISEIAGIIDIKIHSSPSFEHVQNMTLDKINQKYGINLKEDNNEVFLLSLKVQKIHEMNAEYELVEINYEANGNIRKRYAVLRNSKKLKIFEWLTTGNKILKPPKTGPSPFLCFLLSSLLTAAATYAFYIKFQKIPFIKFTEDKMSITSSQP
jgi:hypothetical protein